MASLQNEQIDQSYQGLIKTANNQGGAPFPPVPLQYGDGTNLPISIGDGSGIGIGDIVTIQSGTSTVDINGNGVSIVGLTNMDAQGGAASIANGTFNFGNPFITTNVDFTNATVTGLPSSGGADLAEGQGITPQLTSAYSIPWDLNAFSVTNASGFSASGNGIHFIPFYAKPGEALDEFYFRVQTAGGTGETMNVGLYKGYVITSGTAKYVAPEYVDTIATGIATDSTGKKSITGLNITLPTDAVGGLYWAAFQNVGPTNTTRLSRWTAATSNNRVIAFDIYRYNGWANFNAGGAASLPTGQVDLFAGTGGATTDLAIDFAWRYKA
jgi:hypothetical protein